MFLQLLQCQIRPVEERIKDTRDTLKRLDADLMPLSALIDPANVTKDIEDSAKVSDELFACPGKGGSCPTD